MLDDKLTQTIADALEIPHSEITTESSTRTVEAWDSLGHLKVVLAIEDAFDIRFETSEIERLTSVALLRENLLRRETQ